MCASLLDPPKEPVQHQTHFPPTTHQVNRLSVMIKVIRMERWYHATSELDYSFHVAVSSDTMAEIEKDMRFDHQDDILFNVRIKRTSANIRRKW